jgi:hypothetical protein
VKAAIIIPWRDRGVDPYRARNLLYVTEYWESSPWPVHVVGDGSDGQFNRSRAYNRGAELVEADVLVYSEADLIVPFGQIAEAIHLATEPRLVVPFSKFLEINEEASNLIRAGAAVPCGTHAVQINGDRKSTGAVNVVSQEALDIVGGYDENFTGAWWDDTAMLRAFEICCGPTMFVDGPAYHLYHATGARPGSSNTAADRAATDANRRRYQMYAHAKTPERIRELTSGACL